MGVVIQDGEQMRRKLHNSIQELKGNLRVHSLLPFMYHPKKFPPILQKFPKARDGR